MLDPWDKIASSIRVRPTGPAAAASAPAPVAGSPLGTQATAGEPCPESGWWTCADAGAGVRVYGGALQYLRKGQRVPQALLLPPQTLWEKVRGLQPSFERNALPVWKLTDRRSRVRAALAVALDQAKPAMPTTAPTGACSDVVSLFAVGTPIWP